MWQFFGREYQDTDKYLFLGKHPTVERRDGGKSRMDDPELQGDEQILIRTQGVHVKSISFEAILTNRGIILVDRLKNLLPPKEIPLTTIQSIEPGENAIRDLTITLGVITKAGGARQMVLTFSREGGGNRIKERDEWVRQIRGYIIPSFEQVIRKVIPGIDPQQAGHEDTAPFGIRAAVPLARSPDLSQPAKKIMENPPEPWNPAPSPEPAPESILGTYCTRCGTKVPEGSGFCTKCGTPITGPGENPEVPVSAPLSSIPVFTPQKERPIDRNIRSVDPLIERSTTTLPLDTLPAANPLPEGVQPVLSGSVPPKMVVPEQTSTTKVPPPTHTTKKRFMPKLFSPKDMQHTPLIPSSMPTAVPAPPKKPSNKKKILLAAGIIVVILIAAVAAFVILPKMGLLGAHGSGVSVVAATTTTIPVTTPASGTSTTPAIAIVATTPPNIPSTGIAISVSYIGGFNGSYSIGGVTTTITPNSGTQMYQVGNATGSLTAVFQKKDNTATHPLTVNIYDNGKELASNVTSAAYGKVTVTASV